MARRPFKLPGFRRFIEEVTQVTAKQAATDVVGDLIFIGPCYSGHFANNWEVRVGDVRIPGDKEPPPYSERKQRSSRIQADLPVIPSLRGTGPNKNVGYTIDNRATYRRVAMDLIPGRVENAREISAEQDWYRKYVEAGDLENRLGRSVEKAAQNPRIKGFKSFRTIGPIGRRIE